MFKSSKPMISALDEWCQGGSALQRAPLMITDEVILVKMVYY